MGLARVQEGAVNGRSVLPDHGQEAETVMTPDAQAQRFVSILSAHRGLKLAISVADMAGRLGFERDKSGQRKAQMVKAVVVEQGYLVGSSCGASHGWYTPTTEAEINATCGQYEARIRSLAKLVRHTRGAAGFTKFVGELALEFDHEEQPI
jgi:hypothetical protein